VRKWNRRILAAAAVCVALWGAGCTAGKGCGRVVAVVNGHEIRYEEIRRPKAEAEKLYELTYGKKPSAEELEEYVLGMEKRRLVSRINAVLREEFIRKAGIRVTDEDVRKETERIYPGLKEAPEKTLERERRYWSALAAALREVRENPAEERRIYEKRLKGLMSYETWCGARMSHDTPEKIRWIEKGMPRTVEDIYKSAEKGIRGLLLDRKFKEATWGDIRVTGAEVEELYRAMYPPEAGKRPALKDVEKELRRAVLQRKRRAREREWWRTQYARAEIEIRDARFRSVPEELRGLPNRHP